MTIRRFRTAAIQKGGFAEPAHHISTAAEAIDAPEQVEWRVAINGDAVAQTPTLVAESLYVIPVERDLDAW